VKKARRDTQKASTTVASESVAEVSPPLTIRVPSQKATLREHAQVPDKLDFFHIISFILFYFHD